MELYNVHENPGFYCNLQQKLTSVQAYGTEILVSNYATHTRLDRLPTK